MENRTQISIAVAIGVVLIIGVVFFLLPEPAQDQDVVSAPVELDVVEIAPKPEVAPEPEVVEPTPIEEPVALPTYPPAPVIEPKPDNLNNSDETARTAASSLALRLGDWLIPNEQIRKWVLFIDTAAEGELMAKHRPWDIATGSFKTYGPEGDEKLSNRNFERYEPVISVIDTISAEKLAYYLKVWNPLFQDAYQELGKPGSFNGRLLAAIDQILIAQPLDKMPELSRPSVMYTFSDVRLESAPGLHKLLWRMGPDNAARIQLFAQALRDEIIADKQYATE